MEAGTNGKIFDIRRFSIHDGGGVRTTVFLKGCPLRCVWCQNPEGISPETHLIYLKNRCLRCGFCMKICAGIVIDPEGYPDFSRVTPENHAAIIEACPAAALTRDCRMLTSSEVIDEVCRDKAFFRYGGGVTFSGGEPFSQYPFLLTLLKEAKARGLHVAVETSLYTSPKKLRKALAYIDLLYPDIKLFDDVSHKNFTGVSNRLILKNLEQVVRKMPVGKVIVRTPLIPGYTDGKKNIMDIAGYISRISPEVQYELLNYNPLAEAKYKSMGLPFCYKKNPQQYSDMQMQLFRNLAKIAGIQNCLVE